MRLSIAMIVKNEERNLDETLKAVELIKEKINTEIIVVDTGSTDKTVEIAKKYTDKVFFHIWEDDFAKMRNISLSYCTGDWILVLDADEVLDNPEEVIKLFKDNKIDEYNAGTIKVRNFSDITKKDSSIGNIYRLFKRDAKVKYIGIIHERPICKEPLLKSNIMVNHNGYIKDDYELMEYKFKRNTKLLLRHIKEFGDDIYTYYQLSKSYFVALKLKESLMYINKAVSMIEKDTRLIKRYLFVYTEYFKQLFAIKDYDKCIEICKKVIKEDINIIDAYYILSFCYFSKNDYNEVINYGKKYLKSKEYSGQKNIDIEEFSINSSEDVLELLAICYLKIEKYNDAYSLLKNRDIKNENLIALYIETLIMLDKIKDIIEIFNGNKIKNIHDNLIESINKKLLKYKINDKEEVVNKYIGIDKKLDVYINIVILKRNSTSDLEVLNFDNFKPWKGEILIELLRNNEKKIGILYELLYFDIRSYVKMLVNDYYCIKVLIEYSKEKIFSDNIKELMILDHIEEGLIQSNKVTGKDFVSLVNRRLINKYNYINKIYNKEVLEINSYRSILSNEEIFWYKLRDILSEKEINVEKYIEKLKLHVKESNSYKEVYKAVTADIILINNGELLKEKDKVIEMINNLINLGEIESSKLMLNELKNIVGNTSAIYNVEGVISYIESDMYGALDKLLKGYIINSENKDIIHNINEILLQIGRNDDLIKI